MCQLLLWQVCCCGGSNHLCWLCRWKTCHLNQGHNLYQLRSRSVIQHYATPLHAFSFMLIPSDPLLCHEQGILLVLLDIASARGVARVPSRRLLRPQRVLGVPRVSTRAALAAQHAPHAAMVSTLALVLLSAAIVLMEKSRPGEAPVQPVLSAKTVTTAKHRPAMTAQLASTQVPQGV